jgi:hypothetical protein
MANNAECMINKKICLCDIPQLLKEKGKGLKPNVNPLRIIKDTYF